jgi:adenylosuccinate lyase
LLLALTQAGMSREDAYQVVQRRAMAAWRDNLSFLDQIKADADIAGYLDTATLESLFDLEYHTKHVDTIFNRVFGAS